MTFGGPGGGWGSSGGWGSGEVGGDEGSPTGPDGPDDAPTNTPDVPGDDGRTEQAPPPRLQPMSVMSLFEVSGRIIRRNAVSLLAIAALFQLPSSLVDAAAQQHLGRSLSPLVVGAGTSESRVLAPTPEQSQGILEALVLLAGSSIVGALLGAIATLAFTTAVLADYHGRQPSIGAMIGAALRHALPALAAGLLAALALLGVVAGAALLAVAVLTVLPAPDGGAGGLGAFIAIVVAVSAVVVAVVVMVRLALPAAVLAGEGGGASRALRRSWYLTVGHTWRAFAALATVAIVLTIIGSTLLELLASVITDGLAAGVGLADVSDAILSALVSTLLAPVGGVVLAVLYLDLRVRRDGWQPQTAPPGEGPGPR